VDGAQQSDDLTMLCIRYQQPALVMRNDIQQIPTLPEWLDALQLPEELTMPINLALEEAVTNVMLYAYPGRSGQLMVEYSQTPTTNEALTGPTTNDKRPTTLTFTISDSGIPFDPTAREEVDTSLSAEERPIGGLGIHLVRQIMDEVHYERIDDKNILTLIKRI
jgi:sigma-B regulation protein RsbU (phosphoserine phosphatase)